jgi:hypothetical protein
MKFFLRILCVLIGGILLGKEMILYADPYKDEGSNLSDQDIFQRDNYIHEGYDQRYFRDMCKEKGEEICLGREKAVTGARGVDMTIESIAKMYGMIMGFAGKLKTKMNEETQKKDEQMDWCAMFPMGTEMIAMTWQMASQQNISALNNSFGNTQVNTLEKAKKSYDTRAKTALVQATGFGAATACYMGTTATRGNFSWDDGPYLRMIMTSALFAYFVGKYHKNKGYAKELGDMIDKFKENTGRGACNPITKKLCYCAQEETQYDVKYCMPKEYENRTDQPGDTIVSCIDDRLQIDNECRCKQRNTCYDVKFLAEGNFAAQDEKFGKALAPYRNLLRGKFDRGVVEASTKGQLAANRRWLAENDPFKDQVLDLNKKEREQAAFLKLLGLPNGAAARIAKEPRPDNFHKYFQQEKQDFLDLKNGLSSLKSGSSKDVKGSHILYFDQGSSSTKGYEDSNQLNMDMFNKLNKQKAGDDGSSNKVLMFEEQAARKAQIHPDRHRSIFEIISNRYRGSMWGKINWREQK